ncbi:hypothetical protein [Bacteroides congonensis]|uniref:hypothetical protein n=1 Tax=Bacteroides congonensis TaxID=1871006 RepID=UPI00265F4392|nr:hypothetical protein [Bacteroides congonensis]
MPFYNNMAGYPQQPYYNGAAPDRLAQLSGQYQPQPIQTVQPMTQQPANNGIIWVQGEEGAKAYLTAPGASVMLMDSENNTFYIKSSDQSGMPLPLRVFDYTERTAANKPSIQQQAGADFVTREEFNALEDKLNALLAKAAKAKEETDNG